jgi:hypothetical protein
VVISTGAAIDELDRSSGCTDAIVSTPSTTASPSITNCLCRFFSAALKIRGYWSLKNVAQNGWLLSHWRHLRSATVTAQGYLTLRPIVRDVIELFDQMKDLR